ncbi:hypothetical protein FACS189440_13530 [Bacteroidia bacterium]|nr:hypothetical protein FACS189440_13530 [Bacteroidia bacterium]
MKLYDLFYTEKAETDILSIVNYIRSNLYSPFDAERFYRGINGTIENLKTTAGIHRLQTIQVSNDVFFGVSRINYKGFAIIYTLEENLVIILRVIHGSLITG